MPDHHDRKLLGKPRSDSYPIGHPERTKSGSFKDVLSHPLRHHGSFTFGEKVFSKQHSNKHRRTKMIRKHHMTIIMLHLETTL
jgi:hypothetical protein